MTATVWKFSLERTEVQKVAMPAGARILRVGMQDGTITLWAWVNPDARNQDRLIAIVGTGHPAPEPDEARHLGSVFDGPYVWHIFEGEGQEVHELYEPEETPRVVDLMAALEASLAAAKAKTPSAEPPYLECPSQ